MNENDKQTAYQALLKLVERFGGTKQTAEKLRIDQRTVQNWIAANPAKRSLPKSAVCKAIERVTNGEVQADPMRPDLEFVRTKRGLIDFSRKRAVGGGEV
jgi:DNA-binding transcriptional regulator YdaS (Cro superfamily)